MKIIRDIEQGSDEWKELRLGKVTASSFDKVLAKGRGGAPSKTRQSYMMQLVAERLTGLAEEGFTNKYMEWGNECEPQARAMYELDNGVDVEQVAFVEYSDNVGMSPDGLIGNDGLLEIKCPKTTTQIERYLKGEFPLDYMAQVQGQLWISGREWCDFVSFDPRINGESSYFQVRVHRNADYILNLSKEVGIFVNEMNELIDKLLST